MRVIGLDIHRVFAEAVLLENCVARRLGRVGMTCDHLTAFAKTLTQDDHVVVEATGNASVVAEVILGLPRFGGFCSLCVDGGRLIRTGDRLNGPPHRGRYARSLRHPRVPRRARRREGSGPPRDTAGESLRGRWLSHKAGEGGALGSESGRAVAPGCEAAEVNCRGRQQMLQVRSGQTEIAAATKAHCPYAAR